MRIIVEIKELINKQRKFYSSNISKDLKFRIQNLKLLKSIIIKYEKEIQEALRLDLGKSFPLSITKFPRILLQFSNDLEAFSGELRRFFCQ